MRRWPQAITADEALSDTIGKLGAYAGRSTRPSTTNPAHAKFYGDIEESATDHLHGPDLLELELNEIDDATPSALEGAGAGRYKPWIDDLRKEKPYQLDEQAGAALPREVAHRPRAWSRLFSETMTALRFEVAGEPQPLALEPTLNFLMHPIGSAGTAEARPRCSRTTFACSR